MFSTRVPIMYGDYRGRGGPSKAASATVQCQKCLKRGHYSYECKAPPQERPYVPRPSRTQQLFNPKLLPKLSDEVPDALQRKKGVADEEIAKKEAERARKRELEKEDPPSPKRDSPPSKRRRSPSYDSVGTISTRSPSPARRRVSRSPQRERPRGSVRHPSPRVLPGRRRSFVSEDNYRRSDSLEKAAVPRQLSPRRRSYSRSVSRSISRSISRSVSRSPSRRREQPVTGREHQVWNTDGRRTASKRDYSRPRSPTRSPERDGHGDHNRAGYYRDRDEQSQPRGGRYRPYVREPSPPPPPPLRERSLSPFSKRLALTQSMNMGR
ncbi:zinc knuckle-domain-containing protein [Apodospora peruviana]|uniref:Zinc knuckle-domain-containing protein n=1 Tax=Apodospora peruviana TaxID=516989 RepID=A0AAE0MBZ2_9PEZI|nr:zinc knuckle-domain-containing protein [Apodospora peruviana]